MSLVMHVHIMTARMPVVVRSARGWPQWRRKASGADQGDEIEIPGAKSAPEAPSEARARAESKRLSSASADTKLRRTARLADLSSKPPPSTLTMKLAVLTSGGDSAGMNAAVRAVVKGGILKFVLFPHFQIPMIYLTLYLV